MQPFTALGMDRQSQARAWLTPLPYLQVKTPLLLMLGQEDRRVPFKQGMEYYRALKARNVPVR